MEGPHPWALDNHTACSQRSRALSRSPSWRKSQRSSEGIVWYHHQGENRPHGRPLPVFPLRSSGQGRASLTHREAAAAARAVPRDTDSPPWRQGSRGSVERAP